MKKLKFLPFYFFSLFPLSCLYLISDICFIAVFHLFRYRREVVRTNLINSFPNKSITEIKVIERKFYQHFCDIVFESIKALTINKKSISKRFHLKNKELIEQFHKENRNIIMYAAHYGNWEWLSFLPLFLSYKTTSFYKPLSNKYFDQLMKLLRSRFGVLCFESGNGYKTLLKLDQKNILSLNCIIGDQSPLKSPTNYWKIFLNQKTAFLIGADKIARKSNQVVIFPFFQKIKRGIYEITFKIITEFPKQNATHEIIDKYAQVLEKNINNSPELWLWSHRRWKLSMPEGK